MLGLVASAAALLLLVRPPLPARVAVGMLAVVVLLLWRAGKDAAALARVGRAALAAGVTVALWLVVDLGADVCADYYRYWGGAARRLGDEAQAERAYRGLVEVSPDQELGHFHLGRLLIRRGELEQGLAALREAGAQRVLVLPLFPQYSGTTNAAAYDQVGKALRHWRYVPELHLLPDYAVDPAFIGALADSVRAVSSHLRR